MSFKIVNSRVVWMLQDKMPKTGPGLAIPANDHLWMISGPGLDLKKSQGKDFELEAVRQGPLEAGEVAVTPGGTSGFEQLFHVVVMGQDMNWIEGAGQKGVESLLQKADKTKVRDLIVHPFYRGTHGHRVDCAREMLTGFLTVMETGIGVETVSVLVEDIEERRLLQDLFLQLLRG